MELASDKLVGFRMPLGVLGVLLLGAHQNGGFPFGFPVKTTKKGYPKILKKDTPPISAVVGEGGEHFGNNFLLSEHPI